MKRRAAPTFFLLDPDAVDDAEWSVVVRSRVARLLIRRGWMAWAEANDVKTDNYTVARTGPYRKQMEK